MAATPRTNASVKTEATPCFAILKRLIIFQAPLAKVARYVVRVCYGGCRTSHADRCDVTKAFTPYLYKFLAGMHVPCNCWRPFPPATC